MGDGLPLVSALTEGVLLGRGGSVAGRLLPVGREASFGCDGVDGRTEGRVPLREVALGPGAPDTV